MTTQEEPTELCRVSASGGTVETVVPTTRRAMNAAPTPQGGLVFSANLSSIDAGLWWRPRSGGDPVPLTAGVGEYVDTYLSRDGRHAVATLVDVRQSLVEFSIHASRPERRRLTDGYTGDLHPRFDSQGRRLVFSSVRSGARNLWLAAPDATHASPLTSGTAIDDRPVFSPDGTQIAFVSNRGGRQGIWLVGVEGGAPRLVGEAMVLDTLAWSPDGTRILFSTPGDRLAKLVTMSIANGRIESFPVPAPGHAPAWSPATNRVAYLELTEATDRHPSRTTLAIFDGATRRVYPNDKSVQGFANGLTAWSPDGARVAVMAYQSNAPVTLSIFDIASSEFSQLGELPLSVRLRGLTWSPDGQSILVAEQETKSDIVLFDLTAPR
jgi:Tol biopolymer transport system component